jgi:hypothetical protein
MSTLLGVLNRQHTEAELYVSLRGVVHELKTAQELLSAFGADVVDPHPGKAATNAPETSKGAARAISTRSGSQRHAVLRALGGVGWLADWQIQQKLAIGENSERPRRLELVEAGYVTACLDGQGKPVTIKHPISRLPCQVWRITEKGRAALSQLEAGQLAIAYPDVA